MARTLHNNSTSKQPAVGFSITTLALWFIGLLSLGAGAVSFVLIGFASVFSATGEMWNRQENPNTVENAALCIAMGVIAIFAARGSVKTRNVLLTITVVAMLMICIYNVIAWQNR